MDEREAFLREMAQDWMVLGDQSAQMCAKQMIMVLDLTEEK